MAKERTNTKLYRARELFNKFRTERPMDVIALFIRELDMSEPNASGYYYSLKKEAEALSRKGPILSASVRASNEDLKKEKAVAQRRGRPPVERKFLSSGAVKASDKRSESRKQA